MEWYYALGGQQRGPVTEDQFEELVRSGTIGATTLVWRSGMTDWQQLQAVLPSAGGGGPPAFAATSEQGSAVCAECGQVFARSEMVRLNQCWVCAGCKPIFLQRLAEGANPTSLGAVWRSARQMVLRPETALPDCCIRCTAPANGFRLKRTLYWHSPYFYLLILVSLLIYAIVALCVRKKAVIHIGLCERHRSRRVWFIVGGWLGFLGGMAMFFAGFGGTSSGLLIVTGLVVAVVAAALGISQGAVVSAAKIDGELVWVKGAGQTFLAKLPEWTGPR